MKSNQRYPDSLFNQVCLFVNSQPIGSTFKVTELNNAVTENYTSWKRRYNDPYYCTRLYAGNLRRAGVLTKNERGTWTVLAHIPDNVTLDMINNNKPYSQRWRALVVQPTEQPKTEGPSITIWKIVDKHVEPYVLTDYRNKISALLSTGDYFEDEMDAWYFISVGTGIAVEALKADWKKAQDHAEGLVELTKQAEAAEEIELKEAVERLDGLLTIIPSGWSSRIKYWYKFNGAGHIAKYEVREEQVCKNTLHENESLLNLLKMAANEVDCDIEEMIERELTWVEEEIAKKAEAEREVLAIQIAKDEQYIKVDDIRNKEVYIERGGKNDWVKAVIREFSIMCERGATPSYFDIQVEYSKDGSIETFDNMKDFSFTKEDAINKMKEHINSL
jgi:hypothetical protein